MAKFLLLITEPTKEPKAMLQREGEDRDFPIIEAETDEDYVYYALYFFWPKPDAPLEIIR